MPCALCLVPCALMPCALMPCALIPCALIPCALMPLFSYTLCLFLAKQIRVVQSIKNQFLASLTNGALKNAHVDEGKSLWRKLAFRAELAEHTKLAKKIRVIFISKHSILHKYICIYLYTMRPPRSLWLINPLNAWLCSLFHPCSL